MNILSSETWSIIDYSHNQGSENDTTTDVMFSKAIEKLLLLMEVYLKCKKSSLIGVSFYRKFDTIQFTFDNVISTSSFYYFKVLVFNSFHHLHRLLKSFILIDFINENLTSNMWTGIFILTWNLTKKKVGHINYFLLK